MDHFWPIVAVTSLILLLGIGWIMTLLSLPGTWLIVVGGAIYGYFVPDAWRIDIGWGVLLGALALAVLGEIVESLAVALGAKRAGGSKRAALLGLLGSIGGALFGGMLGAPLFPPFGPVVSILLGASFGAMGGAMLGEHWKGRTAEEGWEVGVAAFWGRLVGTLGKIIVASAIVALLLTAMLLK